MHVNQIVVQLLSSQLQVKSLDKTPIPILKAIGWQLASKYKFTKDKESQEASSILSSLISIRKLIKKRLGIKDFMMLRYEKELT